MKPKDASFLQLHVEKLVLLAGVLFLVLVTLYFVMGNPYSAQLNNRQVALTQIEPTINDAAQRLDRKMNSSEGTKVPNRDIAQYTQIFTRDYQRPILARSNFQVPVSHPGTQAGDISIKDTDLATYDVPSPPLPTDPKIESGFALLAPQRFQQPQVRQAVLEMIHQTQPPDFPYVSLAGTFNMDQWVARLQQGSGPGKIPPQLWGRKLGLAGVYLQRQRRDPATGQWGSTTIVKPIPGQFGFLPNNERPWSTDQATQTISDLLAHQSEVARPDFVPVADQTPWLPPGTQTNQLSGDDIRKLQRLNRQINLIKAQLARAKRSLNRATQPPGRNNNNPPPRRGGGDDEQLQQMQSRLDTLLEQKNDLLGVTQTGEDEFGNPSDQFNNRGGSASGGNRFGNNPGGRFGNAGNEGFPNSGQRGEGSEDQAKPNLVKVWAHDLTVEPGGVYRYRLLVSVINPLFQVRQLTAQQKDQYANRIALGPSNQELNGAAWSKPQRVSPRAYFFVTQANADQDVARIEVWRIDAGRWKNRTFTVQPGDPIGGTVSVPDPTTGLNREIDMSVDAVMVDLANVSQGNSSLGSDTRLLYLDPDTGRIADRSVANDRNNPDRKRLQTEVAREQMLTASTPSENSDGGGSRTP